MALENTNSLRAELERAHTTLKETLEQACSADLSEANTGELIRLEEVLAIASEAAKDAVTVRRRLSQDAGNAADDLPSSREIEDERGVRWLVFMVHPSATAGRPVIREQYRSGWLSFDSGVETRRTAPIPVGWEKMTNAQLRALLARAEVARPGRRRSSDEVQDQ
jgi:hypothetical protein